MSAASAQPGPGAPIRRGPDARSSVQRLAALWLGLAMSLLPGCPAVPPPSGSAPGSASASSSASSSGSAAGPASASAVSSPTPGPASDRPPAPASDRPPAPAAAALGPLPVRRAGQVEAASGLRTRTPPRVGQPEADDAPSAGLPPPGWPTFVDVAPELGLRFRRTSGATGRKHYCEPKGGGVAFFDADGDDFADVYLVDGGPLPGSPPETVRSNRLFRNVDGKAFQDVTAQAGVAGSGYGMGAAAGDYDGDGDTDLFVTGLNGTILYRNLGGGRFEDVTQATAAFVPGWSSSALFVDLDEDGFLDLYVVRYVDYDPRHNPPCYATGIHSYCTPHDFPSLSDVVLHNEQGVAFRDISATFAGRPLQGTGLMVAAGDLDGDGHVDLYVANDEQPNFLLLNQGGGRFREDALVAGVAVGASGTPGAGMGVDIGDVDGDRLLDLLVANFTGQPVDYFRNLGGGLFTEDSVRTGIYKATFMPLGFGVRLFDADNDGDLDLFVCEGHIWDTVDTFWPGITFPQQNTLLRNRGDGTFEDLSGRSGPGLLQRRVSRGVASADMDHDGDIDLVHLNQDAPATLLRNEGGDAQGGWLQVRLVGRAPNTAAIGARLELTAGGKVQIREITAGGGYQSSNEPVAHFGLGPSREVEQLVVRWPPPHRQTTTHTRLGCCQRLVLRQPGAR